MKGKEKQKSSHWAVQVFVLAVALVLDYFSNERRRKALLAASAAAEAAEAAGVSGSLGT